jgi:predicted PurR-regulated permease PerM
MNDRPSTPPAIPPAPVWMSAQQLKTLVLLAATAGALWLCYRLVAPFFDSLTWALVFAVLFAPLQRWLETKLRRPGLAAVGSLLIIAILVTAAVTLVGQRLVVQAVKGAALVEANLRSGEWRHALDKQPQLARLVDRIAPRIDLPDALSGVAAWSSKVVGPLLKGSVLQAVSVGLTFYLLFYLLRDRTQALDALRQFIPLADSDWDRLLVRIAETIHATIYGSMAVAAAQGFLGGVGFWWLDLPAPVLWGTIMGLLALVPMLGAFFVWLPAALYLGLEGRWGHALLLTAWGVLVVGSIDNLLRPVLVGNRLKLHSLLVFVSVVGGLIVFGATGLVLGPVTLTATTFLMEIWSARSAAEAPHAPAPT